MATRQRGDAGQAFPIYVVMVAGLLFLACAFFAVGKASASRSGAQGAADAAALAAAGQARDGYGPPFVASLMTPGGLQEFLQDYMFDPGLACAQGAWFAASNQAVQQTCNPEYGYMRDKVSVTVKNLKPVGKTVIPKTGTQYAESKATAVIEFRCTPKFGRHPGDAVNLKCLGQNLSIDPTDFNQNAWAELSKAIFAVHLIDD